MTKVQTDVGTMFNSADGSAMCEQHPGVEWPHDDCGGPGMPWVISGKTRILERGWQPITTTPDHGTVVLAWGRGDGPGAEPWVEKVYFAGGGDVPPFWTFDADGCTAAPEGWMPLPLPPAQDSTHV